MKLLPLAVLLLAGTADEEMALNRFNDPFEQVSSDIADCPEPRGPRVTAAEMRVQAHHRAERGTTCWLKGECSEPNAFRYDAAIAAELGGRLATAGALHPSSLWVTVQGRVVYFEGCVAREDQGPALEALARGLPQVQQALALVRVGQGGPLPYRRMDGQ